MKKLTLTLIAVLCVSCGSDRPVPQPLPTPAVTPEATPDNTPTPAPSPAPSRPRPTPFPTPVVDLTPYLHEQGGRTVTVDVTNAEDAGAVINAADNFDGPGKLVISGGGKIKTQVVLKHDSVWSGEYFCEVETWEGCVLLHDNTKLEGGIFHEPTFVFSTVPSITVIQTYASAKNNYASSQNVKARKKIDRSAASGANNSFDGSVGIVIVHL